MKKPISLQLRFSFFLILFILVSCEKQTVRSTAGCTPCSARTQPLPQTIRVIVDNWIEVNPGRYNSNFYAAIKKYANGISNISNITVVVDVGGTDEPLWRGTPLGYYAGNLLWRGETLFYTVDSLYASNNPPAIQFIQFLNVKVTFN